MAINQVVVILYYLYQCPFLQSEDCFSLNAYLLPTNDIFISLRLSSHLLSFYSFFFFPSSPVLVQVTEILVTLKKKRGERDLSAQVTQPQTSPSLRKIRLQAYMMCGPVFLPLSFSERVSFVSLSGQLEPGLGSSGHIPVSLVTMGREALCRLLQLGKSQ